MSSTYLPPKETKINIAPTEFSCNCCHNKAFRKYLIHGEVHDPTAFSFGGVAGHAGFFSTA